MSGPIVWAVNAKMERVVFCMNCREVFQRKIKTAIKAREVKEKAENEHQCGEQDR